MTSPILGALERTGDWAGGYRREVWGIYSDPALAQVMNGALKVTKASLFTGIPLLGFPKDRYLQ